MTQLFVEVFSLSEDEAQVDTQSAVCLFLLSYLQHPVSVPVTLVVSTPREPSLRVSIGSLQYSQIDLSSLPSPISDCHLPVFTSDDSTSCVAGLCAVLRQVRFISDKECSYPQYATICCTRGWLTILSLERSCKVNFLGK